MEFTITYSDVSINNLSVEFSTKDLTTSKPQLEWDALWKEYIKRLCRW